VFARAASCDVTPRDRPVRLAGYASRNAPASTVLDPIEVAVVLLECAGRRCLIFSFDLMIVGSELRNMIQARLARLGFAPREVMLLASHTHYAPATDSACAPLGMPEREFVSELADAAENLVRQMLKARPAEAGLEVFQGELDHSINRRRHWPFPTVGRTYGLRLRSTSFAPNPSGPKAEQATLLLLRRADDGKVLAVLWHYTCHPTAVVPANVVSADYPGAVRAAIRKQYGAIPCLFMQGFCGDIRPNIEALQPIGWRQRVRNTLRTMVSGPAFPSPSAEDWRRWSGDLAGAVCDIANRKPGKVLSPTSLRTGSARIPLSEFFVGTTPDKCLEAQVIQIGEAFEIVALSAEACVGWQRILDEALPPEGLRLYAGYLGAVFGYLPTAAQVPEGGYEVEGFQALFGLSGHFVPGRIEPAIVGCLRRAFEDLEPKTRAIEMVPSPEHDQTAGHP